MHISGVLFDGDGVVFDSEELSVISFMKNLNTFGIDLTRPECTRFIGCGTEIVLETLERERGLKIDYRQFVDRRDAIYEQVCFESNGPQRTQGIVRLLDWLDAHRVPYAIASSASPAKVRFNLAQTGLLERFSVVVNGEDVKRGKPAPDIFLEAARRLDVPPQACLVLEDSLNGLRGAIAAGCIAVAIEGTHPDTDLRRLTEYVFKNPGALCDELETHGFDRFDCGCD